MTTLRARLTMLSFSALALTAAGCGESSTQAEAEPDGNPATSTTGAPAPADLLSFTSETLEGAEFTGSAIEGKDAVLWFWAPWCTVCRSEAPNLAATAAKFDGKVEVVGVGGRGEVPEMEAFVEETSTGGFDHIVDADGSIWARFGVAAQPAFAFIDDSGEVEVVVGALGEKALTERLDQLTQA